MPETQSPQIFLGRQPILGREQHLFAYKLLFRDGLASGKPTGLPDPTQATATVIANAFTEILLEPVWLRPCPGPTGWDKRR